MPTLTGEDIYLKEDFIKLIDAHAVDLIHPDLASAGGILETKKIGDYAEERGVGMAMHFAGTPISFMANVHCAAATQNVLALEHHSIDVPWWEDLVIGPEKPLVKAGFVRVPDRPGLGIELNEEVVRAPSGPRPAVLRTHGRVESGPFQRSSLELNSGRRSRVETRRPCNGSKPFRLRRQPEADRASRLMMTSGRLATWPVCTPR